MKTKMESAKGREPTMDQKLYMRKLAVQFKERRMVEINYDYKISRQ